MFTLYLKSANISISFASSELSSASDSKGGIFVIWAGLNLNLSALGLIDQNKHIFLEQNRKEIWDQKTLNGCFQSV